MTSRGPVDEKTRAIIYDLADAFHNIPELCAGQAEQRAANSSLLKSGIEQAQVTYRHYGMKSKHLPPLPLVEQPPEAPPQTPDEFMKQIACYPARMMSSFFKPTDKR